MDIYKIARERTLESMERVAAAAKKEEPDSTDETRKQKAHEAWVRYRDSHRKEIRIHARMRYRKKHPGAKKYDKCWNKKEND